MHRKAICCHRKGLLQTGHLEIPLVGETLSVLERRQGEDFWIEAGKRLGNREYGPYLFYPVCYLDMVLRDMV